MRQRPQDQKQRQPDKKIETQSEKESHFPPALLVPPALPMMMRDLLCWWNFPEVPSSLANQGLAIGLHYTCLIFSFQILFHQDHNIGLQDTSDCNKPRFCTKLSDALPPRGLSRQQPWLLWNPRWARCWDSTCRGWTNILKSSRSNKTISPCSFKNRDSTSGDVCATKLQCKCCSANDAVQILQCNCCSAIVAVQMLQCNCCSAIVDCCNAIVAVHLLRWVKNKLKIMVTPHFGG